MVSKKKNIIRVMMGQNNPSLAITVCLYSANLVMPSGGPG